MLDLLEKNIIRRLSGDIPLCSEPYKIIAEELGISEEELIDKIKDFSNRGIIRRVGGILYHNKSGFKANAMVVWVIPEERIDEVGNIMSSFSEVTHCYQRPTFRDWPYNVFTMIHGKSKQQCENIVLNIVDAISIYDYKILYSIKELKKSSMKYFQMKETLK